MWEHTGSNRGPSACKAELLTFFCFLLSSFVYAIKYLEKNNRKTWKQFLKKPCPATDATYGKIFYLAPTNDDLRRENKVISLLKERFAEWQEKGLPSAKIEEGYNTSQHIKERGWEYRH